MNYSPFLNSKSNMPIKFKNKNRYKNRYIGSKKKNSRFFLVTAVLSITLITVAATVTLLANSDTSGLLSQELLPIVSHTSENNDPDNINRLKSTDLKLPVTSFGSDAANSAETNKVSTDTYNGLMNNTSSLSQVLPEKTARPVTKTSALPVPVITHIALINSAVKSRQAKQKSLKDTLSTVKSKLVKHETVKSKPVKSKHNDSQSKTNKAQSTLVYNKTLTVKVKKGDTLSAIFKRNNLNTSSLYKILNSGKEAKRLTQIKPGQSFSIVLNQHNEISKLEFHINKVDTLLITRNNKGFTPQIQTKEIETRQQFTAGIINNSLFFDGQKAGLNSTLIMKLAHIFGWDVDFALDIRKGDSFAVLYEEQYVDGKKINSGNILSAEFVNQGKVFRAIRYTDASGHTDYYSEKGLSMRKAFLRTPVEFSRISSRFSIGRKHPILNRIRAHKGVDYAAARGTPIKAVGDGKVIFKGRKGGYGRVIILQHGSKYTTLYAHMNAYNKKLRNGSRVKQGQVIGYVGSSGLATGPHLHYEFRINGVHRNPLTVKLPRALPISKKYRADFKVAAETLISQLKLRKQETIALNSH